MERYTDSQVHYKVRNLVKVYPRKIKTITYDNGFYKRFDGFELLEKKLKSTKSTTTETPDDRSLRRTKTTISDIVECTEFDLFCTFTFKKDRQDIKKCKSKMQNWLKSQQKIHGNFQYLIVAEFHKDKKSIHFHALIKNYNGTLTPTDVQINNRLAYNIKSFRSGFTTAIKIDNHEKVSSYVKKYITKDMPKIQNTNRYWSSKGLKRPKLYYNANLNNFEKIKVFETSYFTISETKLEGEGTPIFFSPCISKERMIKIKTPIKEGLHV